MFCFLCSFTYFIQVRWWKRDPEHLSSYKHHLESVAAWVWSEEFQEFKSLNFLLLNCPNQLQKVVPDMPSPLSE
jgi:hypothetical protein